MSVFSVTGEKSFNASGDIHGYKNVSKGHLYRYILLKNSMLKKIWNLIEFFDFLSFTFSFDIEKQGFNDCNDVDIDSRIAGYIE